MSDVGTTDLERVATALPGYEVTGELGRGGWGVVLEGRHRQLGRPVAIKQLPPNFAVDPDIQSRFIAEARVLASLDHPHVVPVYDYVEHEGLCLLVMEMLPGGTVWSRFTTTGLTMPQACAVTMAALAGLHCAHEHGVLHRDVKPENLMFSAAGTLKVTDFGIARMIAGGSTMATRAGEVLGTPAYMAPEQARNGELSPATDVYATGIMLYELLSGRLPFPDDGDAVAMLFNHVYEEPEPLTKAAPSVPEPIAAIAMKAMSREQDARFQSAEEFGTALADAAQESWGPGWLSASGVAVLATGRMAAATESPSTTIGEGAAPTTAAPGAMAPVTPQTGTAAPATSAPGASAAAPAPAPARATAAPSSAPTTPTRTTTTTHGGKAMAAALRESDLVPVSAVVKRARFPLIEFVVAIVLLVVSAALAFGGVGKPSHSGDIPPGSVTLNGADIATGHLPKLDLSKPIVVAGKVPAGASADAVKLAFSAAGISLGEATDKLTPNPDGTFSATFNTSGSKLLLAGRATGKVSFTKGASTVAHRSFEVRSKQSPLATIPGAVTIASLLFIAGYPNSVMRGMRRGRRKASGVVAFAFLGALFGLAVVIAAWLTSAKEPVVGTLAVCIVVGILGGLATGFAGLQLGRRRKPLSVEAALAQGAAAPR